MKQVNINATHPFFEDLDLRIAELNLATSPSYEQLLELAQRWYGYEIDVDFYGQRATISMSDQEYTMWLLRFGK